MLPSGPSEPVGSQFVQSSHKVAGTTSVFAYPGQEIKLQQLLGSMPGAREARWEAHMSWKTARN